MDIFISHSSKDKIVVDLFIEKVLISGCGISEKQIFCTSIEGLDIKTGEDFRNYILETLINCDYSFLLISKNYKSSEVCLNEMGASWALKNVKVKPFLFPGLDFDFIGTIYNVKQTSKLNDSYKLDELFEELTQRYRISKSTPRWNKYKGEYLDVLKGYQIQNINCLLQVLQNILINIYRKTAI